MLRAVILKETFSGTGGRPQTLFAFKAAPLRSFPLYTQRYRLSEGSTMDFGPRLMTQHSPLQISILLHPLLSHFIGLQLVTRINQRLYFGPS